EDPFDQKANGNLIVWWDLIRTCFSGNMMDVDGVIKRSGRPAMKAQLEETVDAAMKVGLRRDEAMTEDALRRGEDYLRLTIDTIPVLAWCTRPDGSTAFLTQRWLDY